MIEHAPGCDRRHGPRQRCSTERSGYINRPAMYEDLDLPDPVRLSNDAMELVFIVASVLVIAAELLWWAALYTFTDPNACADCVGYRVPAMWLLMQLFLAPAALVATGWLVWRLVRAVRGGSDF